VKEEEAEEEEEEEGNKSSEEDDEMIRKLGYCRTTLNFERKLPKRAL